MQIAARGAEPNLSSLIPSTFCQPTSCYWSLRASPVPTHSFHQRVGRLAPRHEFPNGSIFGHIQQTAWNMAERRF